MAGSQTTIYLDDDQKIRVDNLPRKTSFSKLIREHFDEVLVDYPEEKIVPVINTVR